MLSNFKSKIKARHPEVWQNVGCLYHQFLISKRLFYLLNPVRHWDKFLIKMKPEHIGSLKQVYDEELDFFINQVQKIQSRSILEIGCGYGRVIKVLDKRVKSLTKIVGIDFSPAMIEDARNRLKEAKKIELRRFDVANKLPFEDNEFDVVFSWQTLMHIPPKKINNVFEEIYRVARKYIIHGENLNISFRTFRHNYSSFYLQNNCQILLDIINPIRMRAKNKLRATLFFSN